MCKKRITFIGTSPPTPTTEMCGATPNRTLCGATKLVLVVNTAEPLPTYFADEWFPRAWMMLLVSLEIKFIGGQVNEKSRFVNAVMMRLNEVFYNKTKIERLHISGLDNYRDRILFIATLKHILDMCPQLHTINLENNGLCFTELFGVGEVVEGFLKNMPLNVVTMILDGNHLVHEKLDVGDLRAFIHLTNLRKVSWINTTMSQEFCSVLVQYFFKYHIKSVCLLPRQTLMVNVGNCEGVKIYVDACRLVNFEPCSNFDVYEIDSYVRFSASKLM